ncbi:MAG: Fic family protein, partial [Gaiellales bacterium]
EGLIPPARPADAHDILGTYKLVSDRVEIARRPADADDLLALLAERHNTLMEGRPDRRPGQFKREPNRVGTVEFVAPALVEGTLREAFDVYAGLSDPFSRAAFQLFLVSEVHPFDDGNGRIARVMMNAELTAAGEHRLIIPQVYRNNYLMALRALTVNSRTDPLVRMLQFAQRYTAAIDFSDLRQAQLTLQRTHAFHDPAEADMAGIRLTLPEPRDLPEPWRIVAGPREYTRTADGATIDIGWSWDIQRGTEQRTIRVEVADAVQSRPDLPPQARAAISSRGRSGIVEFLDRTDPPTRLLITTAGIFSQ